MSFGSIKNDAEGWIGFGIGMLRDWVDTLCIQENVGRSRRGE